MSKFIIEIKQPAGHKYQMQVWEDKARFIDLLVGRQGGKDWILARKFIKRIYGDLKNGYDRQGGDFKKNIPRLHYWCIAPIVALTRIQKQEIMLYIPPEVIELNQTFTKGILWLKPDILIEFKSAERPADLVSMALNGIYITETARLKANVWTDNLQPTLITNQGWGLFATTPLGDNWYAKEIRSISKTKNADWSFHYWKTVENTKNPALVKEIEKARLIMPIKYFKRNYEADLGAFFGQIYEDFTEDIHIQAFDFNKDRYKIIIAGQDWGYTHKGVLVIVGITHDDNVDIIDEIALSKTPVMKPSSDYVGETWVQIAKRMVEKYDIEMIYAGVDEPEHIDAYITNGIPCQQANNSVMAGIQFVATLMVIDKNGKSRYRIHPRCENLIQNKKTQRWIEDKEGNDSEKPEKKNDDSNDAERYAIFSAKHWFDLPFDIE